MAQSVCAGSLHADLEHDDALAVDGADFAVDDDAKRPRNKKRKTVASRPAKKILRLDFMKE